MNYNGKEVIHQNTTSELSPIIFLRLFTNDMSVGWKYNDVLFHLLNSMFRDIMFAM